jgi:hypothetical protein
LVQARVAANQRITIQAQNEDKQQTKAAKAKAAKPAVTAKPAAVVISFPPALPNGKTVVTDKSADFLKSPAELKPGVSIAKTPPTIDFSYYPGQDYPGNPWSNWGDSLAIDGKYYSAIGDHLAANSKDTSHGTGTGRVFEYDPEKKSFRLLVDIAKLLNLPEGHYVPGKIHSRLDQGSDGWIYFSTHRGSTTVTTDKYHYEGDWIFRCDPKSGKSEVVVRGPVPKHCIPNSVLDPDRLIFYGGTASGDKDDKNGIQFFAYDCRNLKLLYAGPDGPSRYMIFARSTGRLYYVPGSGDGELMRYEPQPGAKPEPVVGAKLGVRAATQETPQGLIYTISTGQGAGDAELWSFNTKTEKVESLGPAAVGSQAYVASLDADPTGRYLYYVPGAHGGSERDGSAVIQFDTKTRTRKVIAFLHPFYQEKYGAALKGTYATAVDPAGDKLYITWNVSRGSRAWDSCALTVLHIPPEERPLD